MYDRPPFPLPPDDHAFEDYGYGPEPDDEDPWEPAPDPTGDALYDHQRQEARYQRGSANLHPDGCFFCGSPHHFSDGCPESGIDHG